MALPRSRKADSTVTRLDAERRKRSSTGSGKRKSSPRDETPGVKPGSTNSGDSGSKGNRKPSPRAAAGKSGKSARAGGTASGKTPRHATDADKAGLETADRSTAATKAKSDTNTDTGASANANANARDGTESSATTTGNTKRVSNRRFDTVKVERIKASIARGEYQINYLQVADKFIEHERYG